MKKVAVLMGSLSDQSIADKAIAVLQEFKIPYQVQVASAHRTPEIVMNFACTARENGFAAIICIAGMAAHLAGAVAANTTLPVIGVPVASGGLGGLDSLLSTVQMPSGIPVATVAVGGAANAALLCIQMLAIQDKALEDKLFMARKQLGNDTQAANLKLQSEYNS